MRVGLDKKLTFGKAAEEWINSRTMAPGSHARYVSPRTLWDLQQYIRALNRKFGKVPLKKIHVGLLRQYQNQRSQSCGANKINQELGTLLRIMKRAGAWTSAMEDCYEPLQHEEADVARALSPEEQQKFIEVAASREEWHFVYYYALLALATSASNCEMRGLHVGDVNLFSKVLHIRREHAKNRYRIRTIPMHDEAVWAATRLLERARTLGADGPHHYLMPFRRAPNHWDPDQPMSNSGIRKTWEAVREAAGVPGLRIHDLRHTAITRMAEAGVPIPVMLSMAGHISTRMQQHYTSISEFAKRRAVEAAFSAGNYMISAGRLVMKNAEPRNRIRKPGERVAAKEKPMTGSSGRTRASGAGMVRKKTLVRL